MEDRAKIKALRDMYRLDIRISLLKEFNERRLEGLIYDHRKSNRNY